MRLIDADALANEIAAFHPMDVGGSAMQAAVMAKVAAAPTVEPDFWTNVKDRLPDKSGTYLMYTESGDVFSAEYDSCADDDCCFGFWQEYFDGETLGCVGGEFEPVHGITHWMPLPEPPEEAAQ